MEVMVEHHLTEAPDRRAIAVSSSTPTATHIPSDGTLPLLKGGAWTLATGISCALSIRLLFGGMDEHGPHTNMGWLLLMVAMTCLPFGSMIFLLGVAKWLRHRRMQPRPAASTHRP